MIAEAKEQYKLAHPPKKDESASFDLENPNLDFAKAIESAIASLDN